MKEWIKKIEGQDIKEAYDSIDLQYKTPGDLDEHILEKIREKHYWVDKHKNVYTIVKRLLIAAAIIIIALIPVIYLYNTLFYQHRLVLVKTSHDVTIIHENIPLLLAPGAYLKEGYTLTTGESSSCSIHYAQKSVIEMHEQASMNIAEYSKSEILLTLEAGELFIRENKNTGATIHITTPLAHIFAVGTEYSVNHRAGDNETIVKVFEGMVHIETIPRKEDIIVKAGEEALIRHNAAPRKRESHSLLNDDWDSTDKPGWEIHTLYSQPSVKKAVTGFDSDGEYIIAGTEQSIVCFDNDNILWEQLPEDTTFISKPVIFNNKVYVLSGNIYFCYDLFTGTKEYVKELRDTVKAGHHFIHYKNTLYTVFASGIYVYNTTTGGIDTEPLIPVIDAAIPAFYADTIYITSYITNSLDAYTLSGEHAWSVQLADKSDCSTIVADTVILSGTKSGILYKITLHGIIDNHIQLGARIMSIIYGNTGDFYVITGEGKFYKINLHTLDIKKVYYNVTTGIIYNGNVIIGMTDGIIITGDRKSKTEKELRLPYSVASAFFGYKDSLFVGLKNGYILKLVRK